jgi:hypothetical protein
MKNNYMKPLRKALLVAFYFISISTNFSQTLNWHNLENRKHVLHGEFGLDFSVSYGLGYSRQLKTTIPIVLNGLFYKPAGEIVFDDFKTKIGGQALWLNQQSWKGAVGIHGIYRKNTNDFVTLQNFGSETSATFGYYKKGWFLAGEVGFDKAIVTHFNHSNEYKEGVYENVKDGWYKPATGGNLQYGIQAGISFQPIDFTIKMGKVISQDFKTKPTLPFYLGLGLNCSL